MKKYLFVAILFSLSACGNGKVEYTYPKSFEQKREDNMDSILTKNKEGFSLLKRGNATNNDNILSESTNIDAYLWRASLDTISFMPLASVDAKNGVIITEWYEDPAAPRERFKINILISSVGLDANNLKLNMFKEVLDNKNIWRGAVVNPKLQSDLEHKIITLARKIKSGN